MAEVGKAGESQWRGIMRRTAVPVAVAAGVVAMTGVAGSSASASASADGVSPGEIVSEVAQRQVGDPYVWGAIGPNSFDCSGLVDYAYEQAGIEMPRTVSQMWNIPGKRVSRSNLQEGDLVFTSNHHVGISAGGDQIVHAPYSGRSVTKTALWSFEKAIRPRVSIRLKRDINHVFKGEIPANQVGLIELNKWARRDIDHVVGSEINAGAVTGQNSRGESEIRPGTVTSDAFAPQLRERLAKIESLEEKVADLEARVQELESTP